VYVVVFLFVFELVCLFSCPASCISLAFHFVVVSRVTDVWPGVVPGIG
jgi:hypothetical protein